MNQQELQEKLDSAHQRRSELEKQWRQFATNPEWTQEQKDIFWEYNKACAEVRQLSEDAVSIDTFYGLNQNVDLKLK